MGNLRMIQRRTFLLGLGSLLAAPAIVRADTLMRVRPWREEIKAHFYGIEESQLCGATIREIYKDRIFFSGFMYQPTMAMCTNLIPAREMGDALALASRLMYPSDGTNFAIGYRRFSEWRLVP